MKNSLQNLLAVVAAAAIARGGLAQTAANPPADAALATPASDCLCQPALPQFGGPFCERPKLTGDWLGARSALRDCGLTVDVNSTQFYQGVAGGGLQRGFPYGGRNDYFAILDGERAGLWHGFSIKAHGETRYGQSPNLFTGGLSPVNEFLNVPAAAGTVSGLTGLKFTQVLSENSLVYVGKINLLDEVVQPLTGAGPLTGFLNLSLIFNPILARTLPYSAFGAGYLRLKDGHPVFVFSVYDTRDATTSGVFDEFFTNGAVIFAAGILPTNFFGRPGHQGLEGSYSSGQYTNITASPYLDPVAGLVFPGPPQTGSWSLGYFFDQACWVSPEDPTRMWGVFGKFGLADDNPNPIRWTATAGLAGASPFRNRDTFGIGYFYLGLSDVLKRSALPNLPLDDEQGVELYYNLSVTPWCHVTPDFQVVRPFEQRADTALVFGIRAKIDF